MQQSSKADRFGRAEHSDQTAAAFVATGVEAGGISRWTLLPPPCTAALVAQGGRGRAPDLPSTPAWPQRRPPPGPRRARPRRVRSRSAPAPPPASRRPPRRPPRHPPRRRCPRSPTSRGRLPGSGAPPRKVRPSAVALWAEVGRNPWSRLPNPHGAGPPGSLATTWFLAALASGETAQVVL